MTIKNALSFVIFLLILMLLGCAPKPSPADNSRVKPVGNAAVTPDKSPVAPPVTPKTKKAEVPRGIHPVLHSGFLMGGLLNRKLVDAETMQKALKGTEEYRCYTQTALYGLRYATSSEDSDYGYVITLRDKQEGHNRNNPSTSSNSGAPPQDASEEREVKWDVAVCGKWNAIPRVPSKGDIHLPEIRQAVQRELERQGIDKSLANVHNVCNIDLDGDGTPEMIVDAVSKNFEDEDFKMAKLGDYTCVILMKKQGQVWTSALIDGKFFTKASLKKHHEDNSSCIYSSKGFYDIDGDGAMEILVHFMLCGTDANSTIFFRAEPRGPVETKLGST